MNYRAQYFASAIIIPLAYAGDELMTIIKRKFRKIGVAMIRSQEERARRYLIAQGYDVDKIKQEMTK